MAAVNQKEIAINSFSNKLAYDYSLEFDGTNDVIFLSNLGFSGNQSISIEAWGKLVNDFTEQRFIFTSATGDISLFMVAATDLRFRIESDELSVTVPDVTEQWFHFAAIYNAGDSSRQVYINGNLVGSDTSVPTPNFNSTSYLIGRLGPFSPRVWKGFLGEVRIWDTARTQAQIKANRSKRLRGDEDGLVAYYRLNEGSGTTAIDSAGSNDGTLTNFPANPWSTTVPSVYQKTFKERYSEFIVSEFSSSINSGLGQATITIPKRLDNIGEAEQVGNNVEIIVYDGEALAGTLVYSGQIEEVQKISGSSDEIQLVAEGHIRGLADDYIQNYSNQFRFDLSSADLGTQFKVVLDYFNYHNPRNPISYDDADITTVGSSRIINIDNQTYLDTLNQIREMAGANYYFYLGPDNKMIFKTLNNGFDHIFTLEGNVVELDETTTISEVKNGLLFAGGSSNNRYYYDETSQFNYGRRMEQKKDERFTNTSSMDSFGESFISIRKDPFDVINLEILDSNYDPSGFDIEAVRPGETLILNNTGRTESAQLITNLTYSISTIQITTKDVRKFVEREVHELREQVERISYGGDGPITYTTV